MRSVHQGGNPGHGFSRGEENSRAILGHGLSGAVRSGAAGDTLHLWRTFPNATRLSARAAFECANPFPSFFSMAKDCASAAAYTKSRAPADRRTCTFRCPAQPWFTSAFKLPAGSLRRSPRCCLTCRLRGSLSASLPWMNVTATTCTASYLNSGSRWLRNQSCALAVAASASSARACASHSSRPPLSIRPIMRKSLSSDHHGWPQVAGRFRSSRK